jgi:hypothetical protein
MSENTSFSELVVFIREQINEYNMPMTKETLIEDDLGITGDEAEELIVNFSKKYNVDISSFIFANYFFDEPGIFLQNRKIKPFTIGHLEKAIIAGRLDEEIINS